MPECVHCGDSGVINVVASMTLAPGTIAVGAVYGGWDNTQYATTCHACEMGKVMAEVGVDAS